MVKQEIGKQIETLRKDLGVSTYDLEKKGIHSSLPGKIERGKKGYSMDSLTKYLNAINEINHERGGEREELVLQVLRNFTTTALAPNESAMLRIFEDRTVCPDCGDTGELYYDDGRRAGTCPCHY